MNLAKRITVASVGVFFFLLISLSMHENLVGMASVPLTYKCVDNDVFSSEPITSRGYVTVISSAGERNVYTDYCIDSNTIREYSCNPNTNQQTYSEESCMYGQVCYLDHCMTK